MLNNCANSECENVSLKKTILSKYVVFQKIGNNQMFWKYFSWK